MVSTHMEAHSSSHISSMDPSTPVFFLVTNRDRDLVPGLLEMELPWLGASAIAGQGPHVDHSGEALPQASQDAEGCLA